MAQWGTIKQIKSLSFLPLFAASDLSKINPDTLIDDMVCLTGVTEHLQLEFILETKAYWLGKTLEEWDAFKESLAPSPTKEQAALKFVEDVAKYGFRIDTNPTRILVVSSEDAQAAQSQEYQWWVGYVSGAEARLIEAAKRILSMD